MKEITAKLVRKTDKKRFYELSEPITKGRVFNNEVDIPKEIEDCRDKRIKVQYKDEILTEDLLLKLGAQRGWEEENVYYIIYAEEEDIYILYENGVFYHSYEYDSMVYSTYVCTGLHSLQNKYYALNGVEMEIKL